MLTFVVSTLAFFIASHLFKRWADENDLPKGMTRSVTILVAALAVAYGVAWAVDRLAALAGA
jgi:hypothetical protein